MNTIRGGLAHWGIKKKVQRAHLHCGPSICHCHNFRAVSNINTEGLQWHNKPADYFTTAYPTRSTIPANTANTFVFVIFAIHQICMHFFSHICIHSFWYHDRNTHTKKVFTKNAFNDMNYTCYHLLTYRIIIFQTNSVLGWV